MIKDIILPSLGEGITEGTVISLLVKEGEQVEAEQSIIEVETDKVVLEVPVEDNGIIENISVTEGDIIQIGQVIAKINISSNTEEIVSSKAPENDEILSKNVEVKEKTTYKETSETAEVLAEASAGNAGENHRRNGHFRASPLARKLARELGVAIDTIKYDGCRVSVKHIKDYVKNKQSITSGYELIQKPLPDFTKWGEVDRKKLTPMGNTVLKNMEYSWATIPHAWINEKVDITDIEASRQKHKTQVKEAGGSLTITSLLVKVCTLALKKHSVFNSSLNCSTNEIIYKDYYNIGVAVDTDRGLLVPVLKNTDKKSLTEISQDLTSLSQAAKLKKTTLEDLEGATFTISNLGGIGSTGIMPIINSPEVGILGVGTSAIEPKWNGTEFEPRLIVPLTIAFDHRIIHGADALRFLRTIKELLENPFLMVL